MTFACIYLIQVASRMDSTSLPGELQCTQEVVDSLQGSHFQFRFEINFFAKFKIKIPFWFIVELHTM